MNAKPLVALFSEEADADAEVVFENPALLGPMVDSGEVDAAIASSFFAVADPTLKVAAGVSIASRGTVESVRLFSKVPFSEIGSLALDAASMTSNHLALILLDENFGVRPSTTKHAAQLEQMLTLADAAVMIGDAGMSADGDRLYVMDLGQEWTQLTGLPFVWALWVGRDGMTESVAELLRSAKDYGVRNLGEIAYSSAQELNWPHEKCLHYLANSIDFNLEADHLRGFELYGEMCLRMGFVDKFEMPKIVGDACANPLTSSS